MKFILKTICPTLGVAGIVAIGLWGLINAERPKAIASNAERIVALHIRNLLLDGEARILQLRTERCSNPDKQHCTAMVWVDVRIVGYVRQGLGTLRCFLYTFGRAGVPDLREEHQNQVLVGPEPKVAVDSFYVSMPANTKVGMHCMLECCTLPTPRIDATIVVP